MVSLANQCLQQNENTEKGCVVVVNLFHVIPQQCHICTAQYLRQLGCWTSGGPILKAEAMGSGQKGAELTSHAPL